MDFDENKPIKINMGCYIRNFGKDWVHIDAGDYPHLDYKMDVSGKMPFEDNTVSLIYSSHVIEYFDREKIIDVLAEWRRILMPSGTIRLAVPDFEAMSKLYVEGKFPLKNFLGPLYGKMKMGEETIYHKTVYDFESLKKLLESLGFINVRRYDWRKTEHAEFDDHSQAYLPHMDKEHGTLISLNIEADKPEKEEIYSRQDPSILLHVINRKEHINNKRKNIVSDDEFLQVGTMKLEKGQTFKAHKHIINDKPVNLTQESWLVVQGQVKAILYDIDDKIIREVILNPGEASITLRGGHTYEALKPDTLVYEYKTGPYFGQEKDKEFI
jgi:predicted SAM-dependent methyltransferase